MATRALTYVLVGQDKLSPVVNKAGKNTESTSSVMGKSLRKAALAFAAVGAAATGVAVKMASDYQSSMQKIVGLVGVSQKQVDAWSKQILALASNLPQSPKELADAMFYITSAGLRGKTALEALTASARAAAAGLGDTQTVADAVTSAMNAYGAKNLSASKATDILTAAVKDGKLEASSLAPVLGNVIPLSSQLGVSFDQLSAAIAAMSTTGMDAATAATSVQAILSGLLKPSTQGAKALAKVGLSYADIRNEVREKGLFTALMDVKKAFGGNDEELAKVIPNVRALRGFLSLTGAQAGNTKKIFDDLAHSAGSTDRAFQSASQTADFKMKSALSSLQVAAINMGSALLPVVASMADAFSKLLAPIAANKAAFITLAAGVLAFAATAKVAMALFSTSVKAALITSVVGVAILGLTVAITLLLTHWNQVWGTMRKVTSTVCSAITNAAKAVWNWLKSNWPYLLGILTGPIGMAAAIIAKHWSNISSAASSAFHAVVNWFTSLPGKILGAIGHVGSLLTNTGRDMISGLFGGIVNTLGNVGRWVKTHIFDPIVNAIKSLFGIHSPSTVMASIGGHLVSGLILGLLKSNPTQIITKIFGGLPNALGSLVTKGLVFIKDLPGKALSALGSAGKAIGGFFSKLFGGGGGGGVNQWKPLVDTALAMLGLPQGLESKVLAQMQTESGGNPNAVNNWDINAQRGDPSKGLMQVIGATFSRFHVPGTSSNIFDPLANIAAAINYARFAYGPTLSNMFGGMGSGHGYAAGTSAARRGWAWVGEGGVPELVHFNGGEQVGPVLGGRGGDTYITVPVTVQGHALATKQEIARTVADALEYGKTHGVSMPKLR